MIRSRIQLKLSSCEKKKRKENKYVHKYIYICIEKTSVVLSVIFFSTFYYYLLLFFFCFRFVNKTITEKTNRIIIIIVSIRCVPKYIQFLSFFLFFTGKVAN